MKNSLKFQLKSLITSKNFNIILILSVILTLIPTVVYAVQFHNADINTVPAAYSFFIGSGYVNIFNSIYYILMPLIVALPFADSYYTDRERKTIYAILSKCNARHYYFGKLVCVFLSGFIIISIPLLIKFSTRFRLPHLTASKNPHFSSVGSNPNIY